MHVALGQVAGQGFGAAVGIVRDTHRAIADRVFDAVGLAGAPVRVTHDAVSQLTYRLTALIGDTAMRGAGLAAALALVDQRGEVPTRVALGALNGAFGDLLRAQGSPLALEMTARVHGDPGPRVAVFIHGLCETEDCWFLYREHGVVYGTHLHDHLGYTPVYVRYNSGLSVAENAASLGALLTDLVLESPVQVREIVLVGHSMGGLVARAACARSAGTNWAGLVRHLVMLGAPHRGAPLERGAAMAVRVLCAVPETRALGEALDARSAGVKDMRFGSTEPYLDDVDHYFFSAGLTRAIDGRLGDLLVDRRSAWDIGAGQAPRFGVDRYRHLSGAHHFDLLGHPAIADQLVSWLGAAGDGRVLTAAV